MPQENTRTGDRQAKTELTRVGSAGSDVGCADVVESPVMTDYFYTPTAASFRRHGAGVSPLVVVLPMFIRDRESAR